MTLRPGFLDATGRHYAAGVRELDFALPLGSVVHEAMIEVDEAGTVAAATRVEMMAKMAPSSFRADQPFLYFLHDAATGHILFAGRVTDPR